MEGSAISGEVGRNTGRRVEKITGSVSGKPFSEEEIKCKSSSHGSVERKVLVY